MKKFITFLIPIWFLFTGCATPPSTEQISKLDYGEFPVNYEATIKKYFDNVLVDPYSAQYEFEPPQKYWVKDAPLAGGGLYAGYFVRMKVNAKNRMGGLGLLRKGGQ